MIKILPLGLLFLNLTFASERPNVVVILSDDQGWKDYGFMGHEVIKTPHLDQLAARGLTFKKGYVASPLCRPSLASIITGRFTNQHGITGNDVDSFNNRAALDQPMREIFHKFPSFVRGLTEQGYLTHQSGKWWEGSYQDGGFTHGMTHGDPSRNGRHGDEGLSIGREGIQPIKDFLDHTTEQKKPFLLWYAPFLPHTPHNPPQRLLEKYSQAGRSQDVAKYYAMCEWFDETCGELLNDLERRNLLENTIVVYICDNGWQASSENRDDPKQAEWPEYALRSKGSPYEFGIRTPIIVSWPAKFTAYDAPELAHAIDILPTIAAATGMQVPEDLPGINLMDESARKARDTIFGNIHSSHNISLGNPDETLQYVWCISGDWKLIVRHPGKDTTKYQKLHNWDQFSVKLYNLNLDPDEKNEVSAANPEIVALLKEKIIAYDPLKNP